MNTEKKFKYIKKHITGLKYINSVLGEAFSCEEDDISEKNLQYLYINQIMEQKFNKILEVLTH